MFCSKEEIEIELWICDQTKTDSVVIISKYHAFSFSFHKKSSKSDGTIMESSGNRVPLQVIQVGKN